MCEELSLRNIQFTREVAVPITYKGKRLQSGYRIDLVVEDTIPVELKCVVDIVPVHEAQLLTYLRLLDMRVGLLLNFYVPTMVKGIRRMVNRF